MFGKLMNSYYYGKSGKGDYRKEDLPKNRWQLFWEMLRVRFSGLMRLNLMYMLAWLPTILVIFLNGWNLYFVVATSEQVVDENGMVTEVVLYANAATAEGEEEGAETETIDPIPVSPQDYNDLLQSMIFQTLLLLIPCIAITGPFTAGASYVTRNWARDEHAFIWSDFKDAVKENWKQGLAISAITSIVPVMIYMCWNFYGQMANDSFLYVIPQMLATMVGIIWMLAIIYMYPLMVTYKLKFRTLLKNGLLLCIARLPQSIGLRLWSLVPVLLGFVIALFLPAFQWVMMGEFLYYILIGYALSRFIYASYTNAVFDRFINPHIEGAVVNRGLSDEVDDDDYEEEDE